MEKNKGTAPCTRNPMTVAESTEKMDSGMHCSQVVFGYGAEKLGIDLDLALRISAGLGGGCKHGEICGTITGAILSLGYAYGKTTGPEEQENTLLPDLIHRVEDRFIEKYGTLLCRDLIGFDKGRPEGPDNMPRDDMYEVCHGLCKEVCDILDELLP